MKRLLFFLLFVTTASFSQAQVNKMLGEWNTFDDRTGDMRGTIRLYKEDDGTYQAEIITLYEKDANGQYHVMKAPFPKGFENIIGTKLFINMKEDGEHLKGAVHDPESQKTYYGKVTYKAKTDELILRGSLDRAGLLGRSQTWKRHK